MAREGQSHVDFDTVEVTPEMLMDVQAVEALMAVGRFPIWFHRVLGGGMMKGVEAGELAFITPPGFELGKEEVKRYPGQAAYYVERDGEWVMCDEVELTAVQADKAVEVVIAAYAARNQDIVQNEEAGADYASLEINKQTLPQTLFDRDYMTWLLTVAKRPVATEGGVWEVDGKRRKMYLVQISPDDYVPGETPIQRVGFSPTLYFAGEKSFIMLKLTEAEFEKMQEAMVGIEGVVDSPRGQRG